MAADIVSERIDQLPSTSSLYFIVIFDAGAVGSNAAMPDEHPAHASVRCPRALRGTPEV